MGRIRVLDDPLINRIAAGEVVERPASVVKELAENALDAGARAIEIVLEAGGRGSIRIADDGFGMDRDDCLLALERHATSKIDRGGSLDAIRTLGFRGEALPSIASVSRLVLSSAMAHGEGTEVEVHGGRIAGVREVARPRGTTVEVASLFFNVPARRKFLRSEATEIARTARIVSQHALARPEVGFRLLHGARVLLEAPPAADAYARALDVLGGDVVRRLVRFDLERAQASAWGFAGRPVDAAGSRERQHLFVNGRPVQDRVLLHAVAEAYGNAVPKGRHAALLLFLDVPPALVDVNVHPQKSEVRFVRPAEIHDLVRDAIGSALSREGIVPRLGELVAGDGAPVAPPPSGAAAAALRFLEAAEPVAGSAWRAERSEPETAPAARPALDDARAVPLAQYLASYIIAEDPQGLLLVDQHVAHERVLFERYLADAERGSVAIQKLLFPITVDLAPDEMARFEEERDEFLRLGFEAEAFGTRTVRLDGLPAIAAGVEPERLFVDLVGEAARARAVATAHDELRRRLVTTAACKAAIKINYPLTRETMQVLLDDLFRTSNPTTCPHGRPIVFRLTLDDIERAFRRR